MAMTMTKQQRSNWVGILKFFRLSLAHSDGTHRPSPPARSYGNHHHHPPPPARSYGTHRPSPALPKRIGEAQQLEYFTKMAKKQQEGGSNSDWGKGMLKRWFRYEKYVRPSKLSQADVVAWRVYEIAQQFKLPYKRVEYKKPFPTYATPEQYVDMLDELQGYVEFMELAHELHSIDCSFDYSQKKKDCLALLLHVLLFHSHAGVRAKTAELLTTMVHNNPGSQRLVLSLDGLLPLFHNIILDPDATSRTKALGAISALIRNNEPDNPCITKFKRAKGYKKLRRALRSKNDVRLQREALNLIEYLLHENSSDCGTVTELGFPHIMMHLASSDDAEVREAALRCLLVLARDEEGGNSGQLLKNDDRLKQFLQERIEGISAMAPKDLGAAREEKQLVDSLWNACYNEPPSFGEKGCEDAPAPDVASKQFEPPLRAWAAAEASDSNFVSEKECNIFTELGLPYIMICLASSKDAKVREAALRGLLVLARDEGGNSGQLVQNDDKLKQVLQKRIEGINAMAPEDLGAAWEEIHLVDSLWNACYKEPSSLKLFEPSL